MVEAGTIDKAAYDALPPVNGDAGDPDRSTQTEKAAEYLVRELGEGRRLTVTDRRRRAGSPGSRRGAGCCPFLVYLSVFLLVPTITVVVGAFQEDGRFTLANINALFSSTLAHGALDQHRAVGRQRRASARCFGALLAYLVVTRPPNSLAAPHGRRRAAACWRSSAASRWRSRSSRRSGFTGVVTVALRRRLGIDIYGNGWLFALPGLILVYTYFQIPLMVIVFLPALDGIRPQWREAAVSLGAHDLAVLAAGRGPAADARRSSARMLLLFANAFAAYATAAAWSARAARSCRC